MQTTFNATTHLSENKSQIQVSGNSLRIVGEEGGDIIREFPTVDNGMFSSDSKNRSAFIRLLIGLDTLL